MPAGFQGGTQLLGLSGSQAQALARAPRAIYTGRELELAFVHRRTCTRMPC